MRSLLAGLGVVACLAVTGCAPPGFACPAIGWVNVAYVTLAQPTAGVTLHLCDGEDCEPGPPEVPQEAPTTPGATATPTVETGVFEITGDSMTGWVASFSGSQDVVGYRLIAADGVAFAEGSIDVEWVQVGGDERCGGPHEAEIVLPA